jgi:hypothetical protein
MKYVLTLIVLLTSVLSWSQFTIQSVDRDNDIFCGGDLKTYTVVANHPVGQIPTLTITAISDNGFLNINNSNNPLTVGGQTSFFVDIYENGTLAINGTGSDSFTFTLNDPLAVPQAQDNFFVSTAVVYGGINPTIDLSGVLICTNSQPFDLNQYAMPQGGDFDWGVEVSSQFDPASFYAFNSQSPSGSIVYEYANADGCNGIVEYSFTMDVAPTVSMVTTNTNCGQAQGGAVASITGPVSPFSVYWSTGFNDSSVPNSSTISNLSSGLYYANITDVVGCKAVGVAHVSDADVVVSDIITTESCEGMNDGLIDITVSASGNVTDTYWSNGAITEDMVGHPGEYSVQIHTDNNCNAFGTYIIPENNISFSHGPLNPVNCSDGSGGSTNVNASGGAGSFLFHWHNNTAGIAYPDGQNLVNATAGVYTCTVTDANLCQKSWDVTIPSISNAHVYTQSIIKEDCGALNGAVDVTLDFGVTTYWQWSNGSVTEDLTNVAAGNYTLEYHDNSSCPNFLTVKVPNTKPYQPQVCLLTVDSSLIYNEIIWEKDPNNIVDGFNIYRETTTFGEFELVTSQEYAMESKYIDNAASPIDRSWRYFITTYNTCGESYGSYIHKTIHIVIESTDLVNYNLAWDNYEGITYSSIDLKRFDNTNGWMELATLPIGTNSYTDTPPVLDGLDYLVSFNLADPCTSVKAEDHNSSRSNKTSEAFFPGGDTDLLVTEKDGGKILMYPNPTTENLNIYIENSEDYEMITIVNMNGELIYTKTITDNFNSISTANFANGIYFVQIYSTTGIVTEKIVKQ